MKRFHFQTSPMLSYEFSQQLIRNFSFTHSIVCRFIQRQTWRKWVKKNKVKQEQGAGLTGRKTINPQWLLLWLFSPSLVGPVSTMSNTYIIAIDFGSAYSGYAFSLTPRGAEINPLMKRWGKEFGLETPKTPTCILFNEDKEFIKFGYEAKTVYIKMRGEDARKSYFFENFKLALYGKVSKNHWTLIFW